MNTICGRKLNPMVENRTQFAFIDKREHIAKVNMPNIAYPNQNIDIEIPRGSKDHVIIPNTVNITFNLDITSTDKARSVVNNVGRALVKTIVLMLCSKEIDTINNSDIYDTSKDLYLSKKEVTSRHTASQWVKGTGRCKKIRWYSTDSDNAGKCD